MLEDALVMGIRESEFWAMTPRRMIIHANAFKKAQMQKDREQWMLGIYFRSALICSLDGAFNGRKAKSKYIEKPILEEVEREKIIDATDMPEEQKQAFRDNFIAQLQQLDTNLKKIGRG